ncbi:MAG TPA: imidazole glycerol phosphate synthase subunit HisH [Candidatus Alectryocaccobium stercorigallinarum]|jgi:glutamine amidotransferase|nr:imidazole glycerol phosphate synthase subunit HisH [Candidatus Alectryocaccobium stercorigallinarum]
MLAIIDYGAGNIKSVEKALIMLGEAPVVSSDPEMIIKADKVILPGVGSFGAAMDNLNKLGMSDAIRETVKNGTPFLGICLGLQLLFETSEESEGVQGLSVLKGKIVRIPAGGGLKIPHMGWNSIKVSKDSRILGHLGEEPYVYFVHSYYLQADDPKIVSAVTDYGVAIHAAVESGNVFATQFHPEKSSDTGLSILQKFLDIK